MKSKKIVTIFDQVVEEAYAAVAKDSAVQPMDLYMSGLGVWAAEQFKESATRQI